MRPALRCKAVPDGDEWVINGTKMWVTNGIRAGIVDACWPVLPDEPHHLLHRGEGARADGFGGITISKKIHKLGYKGLETVEMATPTTASLRSAAWRQRGLGNGLRYALSALELGRINIAARARRRRAGGL